MSEKEITMKLKSNGQVYSMPHGLVVWSTGVGTRPVVRDFMEQIGQVCYKVSAYLITRRCLNRVSSYLLYQHSCLVNVFQFSAPLASSLSGLST